LLKTIIKSWDNLIFRIFGKLDDAKEFSCHHRMIICFSQNLNEKSLSSEFRAHFSHMMRAKTVIPFPIFMSKYAS